MESSTGETSGKNTGCGAGELPGRAVAFVTVAEGWVDVDSDVELSIKSNVELIKLLASEIVSADSNIGR